MPNIYIYVNNISKTIGVKIVYLNADPRPYTNKTKKQQQNRSERSGYTAALFFVVRKAFEIRTRQKQKQKHKQTKNHTVK